MKKIAIASIRTDGGTQTREAIDPQTIAFLAVPATPRDRVGANQTIRLFRRGSEMFWAADGIELQLNTSTLDFDVARWIANSTHGQTLATRKNHEGACDAQEKDESKSEEDRTEDRRRMQEELEKPEVQESPQTKMFEAT